MKRSSKCQIYLLTDLVLLRFFVIQIVDWTMFFVIQIWFSLQGGVITEMVMGIPVEHLDHMVGVDVGVDEAHMVVGVIGRTQIVVAHKSGVPRMATVEEDGKPRTHRVGKLLLVVGEVAVMLVMVVALVGAAGDKEMLVVLVRMPVIQGGVVARKLMMAGAGDRHHSFWLNL